jgi:HEXXH motif-containing protein
MDSKPVKRIKRSLENHSERPWFPELTLDLVDVGRRALSDSTGISLSEYGTAKVFARDAAATCDIAEYLFIRSETERFERTIQVETLDRAFTRRYEESGISFYTVQEISSLNLLSSIGDAFNLLAEVPTISATITALVRSMHLIKPVDDEYDVSFSEPHLPFSIFISIPQKNDCLNGPRVAEAILHEAMHLQLTLIETAVPLVEVTRGRYFSPWKREYRSARGVLHALYVFRVIDCALKTLSNFCSSDVVQYFDGRRDEIKSQMGEIQQFRFAAELTSIGRSFVKKLL